MDCGEVTGIRHSFESTRRRGRPANSFMVSVTAPTGASLVYWATRRVNNTRTIPRAGRPPPRPQIPATGPARRAPARIPAPERPDREEESRAWTSFAPPAGRRRSPPRPSIRRPCPSQGAPM
ncbi:hypothetical protein CP967_05120 [Streptomyces nitrosporeus]|uniref:Uncharacterized protein n=1 Tax=Streptomyces nitrosporeus TaxID=28894 RepID=A0A5J6F556_9ACTN|nr:hypothetical protein CP967_05120 [Streptomyces nitrosporeus]